MMNFLQTIADWRKAGIPLANSTENTVADLQPHLEEQINLVLPPLVGYELTDWLLSQAERRVLDQPPLPEYTALIKVLAGPLAKLTFAAFLPLKEISIDPTGISIGATADRKSAPERNIRDLRKTLLESGWQGIERVLVFLGRNEPDYPDYTDFMAEQTPTLLPTADLFSQYYGINRSRLTYQALKATATRLERDTLIPYLAEKWELLTGTPTTPADKKLQGHLRTWLAFRTVAEAVPQLLVSFDGGALTVHWGSASGTGSISYVTPPTDAQLNRLITSCLETAAAAWEDATQLMVPPVEEEGRGLIDNTDSPIVML